MSKICQITGKKAITGNNVSHSKRHTKRRFNVNLFKRKFYWVEQDTWVMLNVSAAGSAPSTRWVSMPLSNRPPKKALSPKSKL